MPKPDDNHFTDIASRLNLGFTKKRGNQFPESGSYDLDFWADIFGVSRECVSKWIKEFHIPHWGPSQKCIFMDAIDVRSVFEKKTI